MTLAFPWGPLAICREDVLAVRAATRSASPHGMPPSSHFSIRQAKQGDIRRACEAQKREVEVGFDGFVEFFDRAHRRGRLVAACSRANAPGVHPKYLPVAASQFAVSPAPAASRLVKLSHKGSGALCCAAREAG